MFEPRWTMVVKIRDRSARGDRFAGKPASGGKIVLVDPSRYQLEPGMEVPVQVDKELDKCILGHVDPSIVIGRLLAWLPMDFDFSDSEAIGLWAQRTKARWEAEEAEARRKHEQWEAEQAERKVVAEALLDLSTRKGTSAYMTRIEKRVARSLTPDERTLLITYFGLPPWGITDHGTWISTDSYTD